MAARIGTSGWHYADWRGRFYPWALPQREWLAHYSSLFETVEVNNAFYRLPESSTFAQWRTSTPDGFVFAVKASRYLTHIKRLREPEEPVARLLERARHLGPKLGPVLLQLPATLQCDIPLLQATLAAFPPDVRVAFEPRHASWYVEEVADLLTTYNVAFCLSDTPARRSPFWRTANWEYVRFHEGRSTPHPCYGRAALRTWAERLCESWGPDEDVYAFFNNDPGGCAVRDAHRFSLEVGRTGRTSSRVPSARQASLILR